MPDVTLTVAGGDEAQGHSEWPTARTCGVSGGKVEGGSVAHSEFRARPRPRL